MEGMILVYGQMGPFASFVILINSSEFQFVGSNAYWLSTLNTDKDISDTFQSMSAAGIKVVRTWGFNGAASDI
jgi:endo-1,4-beta-mannosidase